jgi:hypothetical protein
MLAKAQILLLKHPSTGASPATATRDQENKWDQCIRIDAGWLPDCC